VELKGRNISPELGFYNGAVGLVIDIAYNSNESPNSGHLHKYVLVQFPNYTGPQFLPSIPNVIPIVLSFSSILLPFLLPHRESLLTLEADNLKEETQQDSPTQPLVEPLHWEN
jgi:hypothetical protein